ncbi:MAG TPA: histidine triad nucleotide-binding protein [Candidatus Omnitrophota bacterium]|nr:histidine triad nucleotide-binding protein [Candidatus Omnitrophota bacterium]
MSDCLFCKIVAGQIKGDKVYEDELVYAFKDINPQAPVHLLVIPKRHIDTAAEATPAELEAIFKAAKELAGMSGVSKTGFRMVINQGKDAGQAVPHLHLHLLGGRPLAWPPG